MTRLAAEFEQRQRLPAGPVAGGASIIALGVAVTIHASAEAFGCGQALNVDEVKPGSRNGARAP